MKYRIAVAALVLFGLTAFAPAPLPRKERRGGPPSVDLKAIQGVWTAVSIKEVQNGRWQDIGWGVRHVYVRNNVWGFDSDGTGFYVTLDPSRRPPTIDFRSSSGTGGATAITGVLRLQGDTLQMLYVFTQPDTRPRDFDSMRNGDRLMTLRLERR